MDTLTFALAITGYGGLTATVVIMQRGTRLPRVVWWPTAAAIVCHVALVWAVRYDWRFAMATRNGYAGFLIFHAALALVVGSLFMAVSRARLAIHAAFLAVTAGALGAVFRYDEVAIYRVPVIALATVGLASVARSIRPLMADA